MATPYGGATKAETDLSQVAVTTGVKQSNQSGELESKILDITPGTWGWSSHHMVSTGSDDRAAACWHSTLQASLGQG